MKGVTTDMTERVHLRVGRVDRDCEMLPERGAGAPDVGRRYPVARGPARRSSH
jgi:hypothetical protein